MSVNAHTHLYSGLARFGMPSPDPPPQDFVEILQRVWWRLDRALDEQSLRAAARFYVAEARAMGTTAIIDHHESPAMIEGSLDILADVCQELGMRALLCYGATERNGGSGEARRGLAECRRFIRSNKRPLVRGVVGLHAAFTVSDETIRAAGTLCRDLNVPLHVHVAEDAVDRDGFRRLSANGALVPGSILAHGVHLSSDEVHAAERAGCWLVHNPRSNRANAVGYASVLRSASRVALGTDGFPSDMNAEAEALDETPEIVRRLLLGSEELAKELFGAPPSPPASDRQWPQPSIDEAEIQAQRLWKRMQEVTDGSHVEKQHC